MPLLSFSSTSAPSCNQRAMFVFAVAAYEAFLSTIMAILNAYITIVPGFEPLLKERCDFQARIR
jgi:hypothetical protein